MIPEGRPAPARPPRLWPHVLALWLWIGFVGGAAVLLGVATPLEARMRAARVAQDDVDLLLSILAGAWVLGSGLLAWLAARRLARAGRLALGHAAGAVLSAAVFLLFLRAGAGPFAAFRGGTEAVGERFIFGPYPDEERTRALAAEGFTGIVTLLSPLVPFEAVLLERERESCRAAGLELVEASMLPWVSSNEEPLGQILSLARSGRGRWYVHCYLGRHRVDLVKFQIAAAEGRRIERPRVEWPDAFERGPVMGLDEKVSVGPLPTRDEWFEFVVRSGARRVVCLLDPDDPDDARRIEEERALAESTGIEFVVVPVRRAADAAAAAEAVRSAPDRVYVHAFRTDRKVEWVREALR